MTFSIIIPVYNAERKICKCFDSIKVQSFKDFEVVFVDDGSKDNSLQLLHSFYDNNPNLNIKIISQTNQGAGKARNNGISNSEGDYIVFLDSDDYVDDDYLKSVYEKIKCENADVVFVDVIREKENGEIIRTEKMSQFQSLTKDSMIRAQLTGKMPWGGVRKIARASIIKDNNLGYAPIKVGEESIFSFRILEEAKTVSFQPLAIYHYVETATSLTSHDEVVNSEKVFDYMYNYLKENGKLQKYITTVRSMAITTTAVGLNVLSNKKEWYDYYHEMKTLIKKYRPYFRGKIDFASLDSRVKVCYPFIVCGCPFPIILMSKLHTIIKKVL